MLAIFRLLTTFIAHALAQKSFYRSLKLVTSLFPTILIPRYSTSSTSSNCRRPTKIAPYCYKLHVWASIVYFRSQFVWEACKKNYRRHRTPPPQNIELAPISKLLSLAYRFSFSCFAQTHHHHHNNARIPHINMETT